MEKIVGILGSDKVGQTLANGFQDLGYTVSIGSRTGDPVDTWKGAVGTFAEVADRADIVVLAVKGTAAEKVILNVKDQLAGKIVLDTTNPITDDPPDEGVLQYFTSLNESLMERLQLSAPDAHFVKVFNSVGSAEMVKPNYAPVKPTMFICGNEADAKKEVAEILEAFGWETEDMGSVKSARAIEPLCILWCLPGMLRNEWSHVFKLLKK